MDTQQGRKKCAKLTKNGTTDKLYYCTYQNCDKVFTLKGSLKRHSQLVHPSSPRLRNFKCDVCSKGFFTRRGLDFHKNRTHSTLKPFGCPECKKSFKSKLGLRVHISSHKGEKSFACPHCPKMLSTLSNLKRHTYIHTDNNRKKLSCPHVNCPAKYEYPFELTRHISHVHGIVNRPRDHICSTCSAAFFNRSKLHRHEQNVHERDPSKNHFICYFCPKRNYDLSNLAEHMRKHTQEKPYRCALCKTSFSFMSNLKRHIFIHTKEKPFTCSVCAMGFSVQESLRSHFATHTREKRFFCQMCDYASFHRTSVSIHVRRIHYRLNELECHLCTKRFFSQVELKAHVESHFKVKRKSGFPCYLCQVRFVKVREMEAHLRRCTGERKIKV